EAVVSKYLVDGTDYDKMLADYMAVRTGNENLTKAAALAAFRKLDRSAQGDLIEQIFFAELRAGGRHAAQSVNADFERAFAALEALFPGSNPSGAPTEAEINPYSGDVSLFFSKVYTLSGGDVRFLVPGGAINVGIATPPTAFGVSKEAQDLGVVAQS